MFGKKKLVTKPDKLEVLMDGIDADMDSAIYNLAAINTPIDTVAYRRMVQKADELDAQAEKLKEIAHRPRRRGFFR